MHWLLHKRNRKVFFKNSKLWAWNPKKTNRGEKKHQNNAKVWKRKKKCHHFRFVLGSLPCRKPLRILESQPGPRSQVPVKVQPSCVQRSRYQDDLNLKPTGGVGMFAMGHGSWQIPHIGETVSGRFAVGSLLYDMILVIPCDVWKVIWDEWQFPNDAPDSFRLKVPRTIANNVGIPISWQRPCRLCFWPWWHKLQDFGWEPSSFPLARGQAWNDMYQSTHGFLLPRMLEYLRKVGTNWHPKTPAFSWSKRCLSSLSFRSSA